MFVIGIFCKSDGHLVLTDFIFKLKRFSDNFTTH